MTEEIKRIIDYLKRSDKNKFGFEQGKLIDYEEAQLLLDCMTNLQQEKERLEEENNDLRKIYRGTYKEYKIYKSRCQKAMELLKLPIVYETHQENGERDELLKKIRQVKDILIGSDENE